MASTIPDPDVIIYFENCGDTADYAVGSALWLGEAYRDSPFKFVVCVVTCRRCRNWCMSLGVARAQPSGIDYCVRPA